MQMKHRHCIEKSEKRIYIVKQLHGTSQHKMTLVQSDVPL